MEGMEGIDYRQGPGSGRRRKDAADRGFADAG